VHPKQKGRITMETCPCHSGKTYQECCEPYHKGFEKAPTAKELMRSRYSAYALCLTDYIVKTTHPSNKAFTKDIITWLDELAQFSGGTKFEGLDIKDFINGKNEAYVTFCAHLRQGDKDTSFIEKSFFKKVDDQWLYVDGVFLT